MSETGLPPLTVGLRHSETLIVADQHLVPALDAPFGGLADMPPVFATAMMIAFIEKTCIEGLRPYLAEGQFTVGTHVEVAHIAATPVGMKVTATVELTEVAGRSLAFTVRCDDEAGPIGEGTHRRAIIDREKFMARLAAKANAA